jgi:nitrite reductase/ring-hydroxylating ferredoxin subunit
MPEADKPVRTLVGAVDDFALDKFRIVHIDGNSIGVVRTKEGFFAVLNYCPHMGAEVCLGSVTGTTLPTDIPFDYRLGHQRSVVRCPWHRWEFDLASGEAIGKITNMRIATYQVEVDGEDVYVGRRRKRSAAGREAVAS